MKNYIKFIFDEWVETGDRRRINEFFGNELLEADFEPLDKAERESRQAMLLATAERGKTDLINALSSLGVKVDLMAPRLHFAVFFGDIELVRLLLTEEDTRTTDQSGRTALHIAATTGDVPKLTLLLSAGADITIKDSEGKQALHYASEYGNSETVRALIAVKASWTVQDAHGRTAVDYAVLPSEVTIAKDSLIEVFKKAGADVERRDGAQRTSLHRAVLTCDNGYIESALVIIRKLVECDVDLDAADKDGGRALHFAVGRMIWDAARLLLTLGANLRLANKNGIMPLDLLERLEPRFEEAKQIVNDLHRKAGGNDWPVMGVDSRSLSPF
jgi:ankyrin repeat protein